MIPILLSVAALLALVGVALALGKWMARDGDTTPVFAGILGAVGIAIAYYVVNVLIDIDNLEFAPVLVLLEWVSLPIAAAALVRFTTSSGQNTRRTTAAAVVPVVLLVLLLNPYSEFLLACVFGRSIYLTQFFGFAGCG